MTVTGIISGVAAALTGMVAILDFPEKLDAMVMSEAEHREYEQVNSDAYKELKALLICDQLKRTLRELKSDRDEARRAGDDAAADDIQIEIDVKEQAFREHECASLLP